MELDTGCNTVKAASEVKRPRVRDMRRYIPELGLFEYWHPAIEAKRVGWKKPVPLTILEQPLALFRNGEGNVAAVTDVCPHRGASMSKGACHFKGTITCPYHAWTFDAQGECLAVLGEGPTSVIPGRKDARIRTFPTKTIHGMVFIWMGTGEPAAIEEDVPIEFFLPDFTIRYTTVVWNVNWRPSVENILDAHPFYVHRNSVEFMFTTRDAFVGLSHLGPRRPKAEVHNGRAVGFNWHNPGDPGFKRDQTEPEKSYSQSYPGLGGQKWPPNEHRLVWHSIVSRFLRSRPPLLDSREWSCAFHLPGYARFDYGTFVYSRATVPIDTKTCRIIYFFATRAKSRAGKLYHFLRFHLWKNWSMHFNFSGQDEVVIVPQNYDAPEHLSPTDIIPVSVRRLILSHARDLKGKAQEEVPDDFQVPTTEAVH